jgi:hypothetical protein
MSAFDMIFLLFPGLFILIGLAMLASPLWVYLHAMRTSYAVTNKRILIVQAGRSRTVQSYSQGDIGDIVRTEGPDKSGDLTFAQKEYRDSDGDRRTTLIQFVGIPEVRSVENLVRDVFKKQPLALTYPEPNTHTEGVSIETLDEARVKRTAQVNRTSAGAQLVFGLMFTLLSLLFGIMTVFSPP